ncbi:hypothetical protein BGZ94_001782 [Podila epigama]|nr:hypothetical protein BGZ94_001782 [Podila epigama]
MSDKDLLAQIAEVAGAINKHMNTATPPYHNSMYSSPARGGFSPRGRGMGRGMGRGVGRGMSMYNPPYTPPSTGAFNRKITLNNTLKQTPSVTATPASMPSRHLSLVNNVKNTSSSNSSNSNSNTDSSLPKIGPTSVSTSHTSLSSSTMSSSMTSTPVTTTPPATGQWIQSKTKNLSMMNPVTFKKTMEAKKNSIQSAKERKLKLRQARAKKASDLRQGIVRVGDKVYKKSRNGRSLVMRTQLQGDIVINGATFVMDPRGNKLIRKIGTGPAVSVTTSEITDASSSSNAGAMAYVAKSSKTVSGATPKQFSVDGVVYVRTKSGNLVRANLVKSQLLAKRVAQEVLKQRKKALTRKRQFCKYFTRFGRCTNVRCPFIHSKQHLTICKMFLRGQCRMRLVPRTTVYILISRSILRRQFVDHLQKKVGVKRAQLARTGMFGSVQISKLQKDCGLAHIPNGGIKPKKTTEEVEKERLEKATQGGADQRNGRMDGASGGSGRYYERPSGPVESGTNKVRQYDENYIPLDFNSEDEAEEVMRQMQADSNEGNNDEANDNDSVEEVDEDEDDDEDEEDVNSDIEMMEEDEEEEGEEESLEEEDDEEDDDGEEVERDVPQWHSVEDEYASIQDEDFYR